ncbi:hypothetical protein BDF22DRAFT_683881 [Syncephalis plumigaleata]|nr:hypothetical protein BDF22DRAFT_683881 [Syncephalis plumigaleata]
MQQSTVPTPTPTTTLPSAVIPPRPDSSQLEAAAELAEIRRVNLTRRLFNAATRATPPDRTEKVDFSQAAISIGELISGDLLTRIDYIFRLYDVDGDQRITLEELDTFIDEMSYLIPQVMDDMKPEDNDTWSNSLRDNARRYADSLQSTTSVASAQASTEQDKGKQEQAEDEPTDATVQASEVWLSLPSFRMIVLAEPVLERLFEVSLPNSFRLEQQPQAYNARLGREIFNSLWSEGTKLAKNVGKRVATRRPSNALRRARRSTHGSVGTATGNSASAPVTTTPTTPVVDRLRTATSEDTSGRLSPAATSLSSVNVETEEESASAIDEEDISDVDMLEEVDRLLNELGHGPE